MYNTEKAVRHLLKWVSHNESDELYDFIFGEPEPMAGSLYDPEFVEDMRMIRKMIKEEAKHE